VAGFASGFISSTAAIISMGNRSRTDPRLAGPSAGGAISSVLGSLVYLIALVAAANADLLHRLAVPLGFAATMTLCCAVALNWRLSGRSDVANMPGRAFNIWTAMLFAALVAVFAVVSTALTNWLGTAGALGSAAATGLVDAHAAAVSLATLSGAGELDEATSALGILIGLSANMAAKVPTAFVCGPRPYAIRVTVGLALLLLGIWAGYGLIVILRS
jgi:uncharacterized membrane protein (DUF4010 family)